MFVTQGSKVVLIGAGAVGTAYAYAILNQGLADHLAIIDLNELSLIHISEPTRRHHVSRMPSSA